VLAVPRSIARSLATSLNIPERPEVIAFSGLRTRGLTKELDGETPPLKATFILDPEAPPTDFAEIEACIARNSLPSRADEKGTSRLRNSDRYAANGELSCVKKN